MTTTLRKTTNLQLASGSLTVDQISFSDTVSVGDEFDKDVRVIGNSESITIVIAEDETIYIYAQSVTGKLLIDNTATGQELAYLRTGGIFALTAATEVNSIDVQAGSSDSGTIIVLKFSAST